MASLKKFWGVFLVFVGTLSACGGSTVAPEGGGGSAGTGGAAAGGGATVTCDVVGATVSQMHVDPTAVACVKANCSSNFAPCLGENYAQGNFGTSPCAPYATCVNNCNCAGSCSSNCVAPTDCINCLSNHVFACTVVNCLK